MAEIEINVMVSQCLDRRINSIKTVRSEVGAWHVRHDNHRQSQLAAHNQECPS